ncbi:uncharacterized protein LOC135698435 [Ochlerotatus camptorhynchus]|uniref:uncharacterized protein LOC135698435 n=1 Tax=Ochlerotatus camptorhynchus TaxID=644619 RepID=UPI0031D2F279
MNPYIRSLTGLVVVMLIGISQQVQALTGFIGSEQSYYFGTRLDAANNCFEQQLHKGTALPTTVSFMNTPDISFIAVSADKYSKIGFQANMKTAALPQPAVTLQLDGPVILPYNVLIQMWC